MYKYFIHCIIKYYINDIPMNGIKKPDLTYVVENKYYKEKMLQQQQEWHMNWSGLTDIIVILTLTV